MNTESLKAKLLNISHEEEIDFQELLKASPLITLKWIIRVTGSSVPS